MGAFSLFYGSAFLLAIITRFANMYFVSSVPFNGRFSGLVLKISMLCDMHAVGMSYKPESSSKFYQRLIENEVGL